MNQVIQQIGAALGLPSQQDIQSGVANAESQLQTAFVIIIVELGIIALLIYKGQKG